MPRASARVAILLSVLAVSSACTSGLQKRMQSWVGSTESQLLQSWGAPDRTQALDDGSKIHTWVDTWFTQQGQPVQCRKTFTVDRRGQVVKWSYAGCPRRLWER